MAKKQTNKTAVTNSNFTNVSKTEVWFRYTATRKNGSPDTVLLSIEPCMQHSSSSSNSGFVFFNEPTLKSSTAPNTFTHVCLCNKGRIDGNTDYSGTGPWYGATGTKTASSDSDFPLNSDGWVIGNWTNIEVTVPAADKSVTLYFYFTNYYGYGNFNKNMNNTYQVWKNSYYGAKQNRISATFEVPVGYTDNGAPSEPTIGKCYWDEESGEYWADDSLSVSWKAGQTGTNNSVKSYDIYANYFHYPDGWKTKKIKTGVTSPCTITRGDMKSAIGSDANELYTTNKGKGWHLFTFFIRANNKYGTATIDSPASSDCRWNERPTTPTLRAKINGHLSSTVGGTVTISTAFAKKMAFRADQSIDRFLPNLNPYSTNGDQFPKNYSITYYNGANELSYTSSDLSWMTNSAEDNFFEAKIPTTYGPLFSPGKGLHRVKAYAKDGQLTSPIAYASYIIGKSLYFNNKAPACYCDDQQDTNIGYNSQIRVPSIYVDSVNYKLYNTSVQLTLQAKLKEEKVWTNIDTATLTSTSTIDGSYTFTNIYSKIISAIYVPTTTDAVVLLQVIIRPLEQEALTTTLSVHTNGSYDHIISKYEVTTINGGLDAVPSTTLLYGYRQFTPKLSYNDSFSIALQLNGPPGGRVTYAIEASPVNRAIEDPNDEWTPIITGVTNINTEIVHTLSMNSFQINEAFLACGHEFKLRLKANIPTNKSLIYNLHWPSKSSATSTSELISSHVIKRYETDSLVMFSYDDLTTNNILRVNIFNGLSELTGTNEINLSGIISLNSSQQGNSDRAISILGMYIEDPNHGIVELLCKSKRYYLLSGLQDAKWYLNFLVQRIDLPSLQATRAQFTSIGGTIGGINLTQVSPDTLIYEPNSGLTMNFALTYAELFSTKPGWSLVNDQFPSGLTENYIRSTNTVIFNFIAKADLDKTDFKTLEIKRATKQEGGE